MPPKRKGSHRKDGAQTQSKKAKMSKASEDNSSQPAGVTGNKKGDSSFKLDVLLAEPGWHQALQAEMEKDYFKDLEAKLAQDYRSVQDIFPPQDLIFNAFNLTPLSKVKAVILGQDPYHDYGQAMGLAFSVPKDVQVPGSLCNIFKELENDIADFQKPDHGCLERWAKEGVLLLNTTLTVEAHKPNSHKSYGWQIFTDEVIRTVSNQKNMVVFILWGNFAHKKEKLINTVKHVVVKNAHPSPLTCGKFFNCKCFSKTNEMLIKAGIEPIDWKIL